MFSVIEFLGQCCTNAVKLQDQKQEKDFESGHKVEQLIDLNGSTILRL